MSRPRKKKPEQEHVIKDPMYRASNGHTVRMFGRLFFIVTSASRRGLVHFVDLEESPDWKSPMVCTCEAFKYGARPCRHITACLEALAEWAGVPQDNREQWIEYLTFLLQCRMSFTQALNAPIMRELRNVPEHPDHQPEKRTYNLKPR